MSVCMCVCVGGRGRLKRFEGGWNFVLGDYKSRRARLAGMVEAADSMKRHSGWYLGIGR